MLILFLSICAYITITLMVYMFYTRPFLRRAVETTATLESDSSLFINLVSMSIVFKDQTGQRHSTTLKFSAQHANLPKLKMNDTVDILYDPKKPTRIMQGTKKQANKQIFHAMLYMAFFILIIPVLHFEEDITHFFYTIKYIILF